MARLILSTAEGQQAIELRPVNSLGRHPNNSIQLLDKIVSKEHCIIELRGDHFVLRDLGSLNGTFVNNERVRGESPLKHGDEIALGSTRGRFDDGSSPLSAAASHVPAASGPAAWPSAGAPSTQANPGASPLAQSGQVMPGAAFQKQPYSAPYAQAPSQGAGGPSPGAGQRPQYL